MSLLDGLTGDQIALLLGQKAAPGDLIDATVSFLRQCDFARFAPAELKQDDLSKALSSAEEIMVKMEGIRFS